MQKFFCSWCVYTLYCIFCWIDSTVPVTINSDVVRSESEQLCIWGWKLHVSQISANACVVEADRRDVSRHGELCITGTVCCRCRFACLCLFSLKMQIVCVCSSWLNLDRVYGEHTIFCCISKCLEKKKNLSIPHWGKVDFVSVHQIIFLCFWKDYPVPRKYPNWKI